MKVNEIFEHTDIDDITVTQKKEVPLHVPGGATVVVLNDNVTPFPLAIEAIMHGTGLSESEASRRAWDVHRKGWAAIASYPTVDIAETVASNIENYARNSTDYDMYRRFANHYGPWPLTCEVMDADQAK